MAKVIHGELKFDSRSIGQVSDLMAILATNGYIVEIKLKEDLIRNKKELIVTVMTEGE